MKESTLITVLGWEDRFPLGMDIIFKKYSIKKLILISFKDYCSMNKMSENRDATQKLVKKNDVQIENVELEYSNSVENWKILDLLFNSMTLNDEVLLNITTIPRETIWTLLFFLKKQRTGVDYVYFKPKSYCEKWLTKNHKNPRLLFKHSGVFELNLPLVLFVITGFDGTRLNSLLEFYEPSKIIVFGQKGNQFNNQTRNNGINISKSLEFEKVEIDSYNVKESAEIISLKIKQHENYNIIVSSQGPKLSSLSTYLNYLNSDGKLALAYVPAKEFNFEYSSGIDENSISGRIEF